MNKIFAIARKDLMVRFSTPSEWIFFLALPLMFTIVISLASGVFDSRGDPRILLLVVDHDGGELAQDLITALNESNTVRPEVMSQADAEAKFRESEAAAILVIPAGLDAAQAEGRLVELGFSEASGNTNAIAARQAVLAALGAVGRSYFAADVVTAAAEEIQPFADAPARKAFLDETKRDARTLFADAPERIVVTRAAAPAKEDEPVFWSPATQASAGQLITWVFIPLLAISEIFATERQLGTLRRLISAPVSKAVNLLGTIAGQLVVALAQMFILSIAGTLILGLGWWRDPIATLTMFLAFGLASVAFGTMLGTFVRTTSQAAGISIALGMVMALLGGCWYPRDLFPGFVQNLTLALPTTWAMLGLNDILLRQQGLLGVLPEAGALAGFAAVFFVIGILRYRYE